MRHGVEASTSGSVLVVACKDAAARLTAARKSAVFRDKSDSAIMKELITAASLELGAIPDVLRDRLEVIPLSGYTVDEKLAIAREHLLPRQRAENGLRPEQVEIADDVLLSLATAYTRESGVRNLERELAALLRDIAMHLVEGKQNLARIDADQVLRILGPPRYHDELAAKLPAPPLVRKLREATMQDLEEQTKMGRRKLRFHIGQLVKHGKLRRHGMGRGTCSCAGPHAHGACSRPGPRWRSAPLRSGPCASSGGRPPRRRRRVPRCANPNGGAQAQRRRCQGAPRRATPVARSRGPDAAPRIPGLPQAPGDGRGRRGHRPRGGEPKRAAPSRAAREAGSSSPPSLSGPHTRAATRRGRGGGTQHGALAVAG